MYTHGKSPEGFEFRPITPQVSHSNNGVFLSLYQAVIGIECHVQLDTTTKLFCGCPIVHNAPPNSAVCSVCTGQPGALPAINAKAVLLGLRAGLALGCTLHDRSVFARKNYFYPDLPKGYQISQFDEPLCTGGAVHTMVNGVLKRFRLTRIHLEEDAGKLLHDQKHSRIDWNRAGTPLAEIVSEPEMHSAEDAIAYMKMLHRCMVEAKVCHGDMEKGHMRFDVNVSIHRPGEPWGTRVEIKNLNSFRFAAKAINGEIERQKRQLDKGEKIKQHTRGWTGSGTAPLREKEEAADYRYFPDPDLPALQLTAEEKAAALSDLPATPLDKHLLHTDEALRTSWKEKYGLPSDTVEILLADARTGRFFEQCVKEGGSPTDMAAWVQTELLRCLKPSGANWALVALQPQHVVELQALIDNGDISHTAAKKVFEVLFKDGGSTAAVVEKLGLLQIQDETLLDEAVQRVLEEHPDEHKAFQEGNTKVVGFFMGKLMRQMAGAADPQLLRNLLLQRLGKLK